MENASKAILITTGVLLAIMLITVTVLAWENAKDSLSLVEKNKLSQIVDVQTKKFSQYAGEITGIEVKNCIRRTLSYNEDIEGDIDIITVMVSYYDTELAYQGFNSNQKYKLQKCASDNAANNQTTTEKFTTIDALLEKYYPYQVTDFLSAGGYNYLLNSNINKRYTISFCATSNVILRGLNENSIFIGSITTNEKNEIEQIEFVEKGSGYNSLNQANNNISDAKDMLRTYNSGTRSVIEQLNEIKEAISSGELFKVNGCLNKIDEIATTTEYNQLYVLIHGQPIKIQIGSNASQYLSISLPVINRENLGINDVNDPSEIEIDTINSAIIYCESGIASAKACINRLNHTLINL